VAAHNPPNRPARLAASPPRRQSGAVLLLSLLVFLTAAAFVLVSKLNKAATQAYRDDQTARALAEAKAALIGRAVMDGNRPGSLRYPDYDHDGDGDPSDANTCNNDSPPLCIGRLPWKTLDLPELRDGSGETLWYAVSRSLRDQNTAQPINSDTLGNLRIDGNPNLDIVAVIIAPGASFDGQNRPSNVDDNYLEGDNNNGDTDFVSRAAGNFNDLVIAITRQELMAAVEKRVLGEARQVLRTYYANNGNQFYPYAAVLGSTPENQVGQEGLRRGFLPIDNLAGSCTCTFDGITSACNCSGNGTFKFESPGNIASVSGNCQLNGSDSCTCTWQSSNTTGTCTINSDSFTSANSTFTATPSGPDNICSFSVAGETCTTETSTHVSPTVSVPAWFTTNQWQNFIYYTVSAACTSGTPGCGGGTFLSVGSPNNAHALLISAGRSLLTGTNCNGTTPYTQRTRPTANICDYLDSAENTDTVNIDTYDPVGKPLTQSFNDQARIVAPP
jgi:hypothetical protein